MHLYVSRLQCPPSTVTNPEVNLIVPKPVLIAASDEFQAKAGQIFACHSSYIGQSHMPLPRGCCTPDGWFEVKAPLRKRFQLAALLNVS